MTTNIIFAGANPLINEKFICQKALYLHTLAPLHSAIDRGEQEKYLFLPLYWIMENTLMKRAPPESISNSEKVKKQLCFVFSVV